MGRRKVEVETEVDEVRPEWLGGLQGTCKIYREFPPAGYLDTVDAAQMDEEFIKKRWGGGMFKVLWMPPPEAVDMKPKQRIFEINAPHRKLGHNEGGDGSLAAQLQTLLQGGSHKDRDKEWSKLLDVQRTYQQEMMTQTVALLTTQQTATIQMMQQAREADAARVDAARAEDVRRHEHSMERERLYHQQTIETQNAAHRQMVEMTNQNHGMLDNLGELGKVAELLKGLGGDSESTAQTIVKAIPDIIGGIGGAFNNAAEGYSNAVHAAKEARTLKQKQLPDPDADDGDIDEIISRAEAGTLPETADPSPPTQSGASGDAEVAPSSDTATAPARRGNGRTEEFEAYDEEWCENTAEGREFCGWIDYMEVRPSEQWLPKIRRDYSTDDLPAALVAPLETAFKSNQWTDLVALFDRAGAGELLAEAMGQGKSDAAGEGSQVGPASSAGAGVDVDGGEVETGSGQRADPQPPGDDSTIPGPSDDSLGGIEDLAGTGGP